MDKKVVYVKLITGEELITTHTATAQETFTFENTVLLVVGRPDKVGAQPPMGFMPFLPYTNASVKVAVNRNSVQLMCDPHHQLIQEYQKITGSIITPKTGLIIP